MLYTWQDSANCRVVPIDYCPNGGALSRVYLQRQHRPLHGPDLTTTSGPVFSTQAQCHIGTPHERAPAQWRDQSHELQPSRGGTSTLKSKRGKSFLSVKVFLSRRVCGAGTDLSSRNLAWGAVAGVIFILGVFVPRRRGFLNVAGFLRWSVCHRLASQGEGQIRERNRREFPSHSNIGTPIWPRLDVKSSRKPGVTYRASWLEILW
jgi:hypothetical protein